jgi:hypothetical protein
MIGIVACKLSTDDAWDVILGLLAAAPNENVLGNVGASPLEDLLNRDPEAVAALIEREAPNNERLRRALHHTWRMNTPEEIVARVKSFAQQP